MLDLPNPPQLNAAFAAASPVRPPLQVVLAAPRGFCAGVRRAIDAVEDALRIHGAPVYVRRAIVHNMNVVRSLEAKGAVFVEELEAVPEGAVAILSAHGVARSVAAEAAQRQLLAIDAVCPLVAKVHREVVRHHRAGRWVVLIGHRGHPEIVGTLGQLPHGAIHLVATAADVAELPIPENAPVAYAVQTTFSVDEAHAVVTALEARFVDLAAPPASDICYATSNRQAALKAIATQVDAVIVAGESFSSNATRLAELARAMGCPSVQLVASADQIDWARLDGRRRVGLTAAASTPETVVSAILDALGARFRVTAREAEAMRETMVFKPVKVA
ncbi:MAG TPA: 4-hydroxy-3-methylbut-2-enyl diphosphate reductase [Allosphingosinicella sp.]|nr:4-hydroxy-3-methylbut-2-enyl diphosphate reductase [Allosphingosinicella sp.]